MHSMTENNRYVIFEVVDTVYVLDSGHQVKDKIKFDTYGDR